MELQEIKSLTFKLFKSSTVTMTILTMAPNEAGGDSYEKGRGINVRKESKFT